MVQNEPVRGLKLHVPRAECSLIGIGEQLLFFIGRLARPGDSSDRRKEVK